VERVEPVNVFEYVDYRALLRALFAHRKARERGFSHRAFSRRAGLRSSNYLSLVMKGERSLSPEMAFRFAQGFGLKKREADYFCELVGYNQASTTAERARRYERLARFRSHRDIYTLSPAQAEYHSAWYIPAVRELVARADFRTDPRWIARTLQPSITPAQAERALEVLQALSLVRRDGRGKLVQQDPVVSTGQRPLGHHIVAYHRAMLERAAHALDEVAREEREISSLTLCVSHEVMLQLKERIREFRRELLHFAEQQGAPERVVQIGFALFPLSRRKGESDV
jgi:uncharacterized protein (TIGR02147 family)